VGGSDAARTACSSYSFLVVPSSSYTFCPLQKPEEDDDEEEEQELQELEDGLVILQGPIQRLQSSSGEGILAP
jgi:hypothetical protein